MQSNAHRPFKVGILGCGNQAADHAAAYALLAGEGVEVTGVADVNHDRAVAFAGEHARGAQAFASLDAMLEGAKVDAVSIVVPNKFHHGAALAALRARKHVLCEKPPALTREQAAEMEQFARERGLVLTYGVLYRQMYEHLLPFVQELDEIYAATASWVRLRGVPGWGIYGDKEMQGGGAGIDLGVHVLDLAWWLMGRPLPLHASARTFARKHFATKVNLLGNVDPDAVFTVEDTLRGTIDFPYARLSLDAAFAADVAEEEVARIRLQGVHGALEFRLMTAQAGPDPACAPVIYTERHGRTLTQVIQHPLPMTSLSACSQQVARFVAACRDGAPLLAPAEDGTAVQGMLDALYASADIDGRTVRIV